MINVQDFSLRIGARELVRSASFRIDKGMRIGLVGRNGAGKTTTMRLLAGEADEGGAAEHTGTISSTSSIGYLAQDTHVGDQTMIARDRITSVRGIDELIARIRKAEHEMATTQGARQRKAMDRYVRLDQEFTTQGGWAANAEAAQIAHSLGLEDRVLDQRLDTLSGGQRRRVELARVLFSGADVLLLDEPTNHLDHDSIIWLRDWITTFSGGVMMISHDVKLLGETVNQVFFLDASRAEIDIYHLGWSAYLRQREEDERRRRKERANALKKAEQLRAQGEKMRAKATKAVAAQQMLRRADELLAQAGGEARQERVARLRFPDPAPCGRVPLTAEGLSKSYGSLEVFTGVDLAIDRGAKVVVLGLNGAGKTTLLRLLSGIEEADTGEVVPGHGLRLGYYAQEHETLDPAMTVRENMAAAAPGLDDTHVRSVLGQFLFVGDDVDKPTSVLSGGEKTRLALATLVVSGANVLLLDEPTNNLDPASREEVLSALRSYEGAVVLVTHDPGAVQALAPDRVLLLPDADEDLWDDSYLDLVTLT
ncbi:ATP-binding cassette domain-containing protein [Actinomyces sp. B33]|uniref:ABC-F family ATP-binding cassette domain-containing protein n=1 Tax=Actinomyces sp. B33 TaxID=2942131 RepID=UPI00233F97E4|nr:ABC-F family ATP-binding cassette domain-containing protein [Actinomyces sp. B33]MDC4233379.1 ATP-binding cassette domain-containing protein [Actinomyces sp. B33]